MSSRPKRAYSHKAYIRWLKPSKHEAPVEELPVEEDDGRLGSGVAWDLEDDPDTDAPSCCDEPATLNECGSAIEVSRERVRQIIEGALGKLRRTAFTRTILEYFNELPEELGVEDAMIAAIDTARIDRWAGKARAPFEVAAGIEQERLKLLRSLVEGEQAAREQFEREAKREAAIEADLLSSCRVVVKGELSAAASPAFDYREACGGRYCGGGLVCVCGPEDEQWIREFERVRAAKIVMSVEHARQAINAYAMVRRTPNTFVFRCPACGCWGVVDGPFDIDYEVECHACNVAHRVLYVNLGGKQRHHRYGPGRNGPTPRVFTRRIAGRLV